MNTDTNNSKTRPTPQLYDALQHAYDTFNIQLFDGTLDNSLITLQRQANTMGYMSYNRFVAVIDNKTFTHELALNPDYFGIKPLVEVLQTIVHEMCHLWQSQYGTPSQKSYHNKEWAAKMESIGLMPSDTGRVGGKKIGQKVADYPINNGRFIQVCNQLFWDDGFIVSWYDRFVPRSSTLYQMIKDRNYAAALIDHASENLLVVPHLTIHQETPIDDHCTTPETTVTLNSSSQISNPIKPTTSKHKFSCSCGENLWGKPTLNVTCNICNTKFMLRD